ncbi:Predicted Zn-dependent protease, minimal metalloprotease (MMP)-like domain [Geoalkalibacter ferrihydriticus]|uniref:Predicted Zn-dependent protease, minimal metalloprotease (MMP)-like domain n=1 Tax=Geoalkalibacter ferrihydriticus TaxID=392333 RepID=A0A1G9UYS6_9BACT|nr:metallopeptidase family protein [Geoalkalibacter ferrihydriticus]SDM65132.1 Predicted Zn-dependent protease, minimal metalloprotease (MMP)-like domain [Geoalkalibacter ferrihydriticus]
MTRTEFEEQVERAIASIPAEFLARAENLSFQVHDWADDEILSGVGLEDPRDLLGYYMGWPLTERSIDFVSTPPDLIIIFQKAVENFTEETGQPLARVLRETVMHELAHYFGFSEDEMDLIEQLWEEEKDDRFS